MIQKEVLVRTVWVGDKAEELPHLQPDTIAEMLRLLALEKDGRLLGKFLLFWAPTESSHALGTEKYYQALGFALSCDETHCSSAWREEAYSLMVTGFDIAIASQMKDGRLLSSLDTLRRKALGQARYTRVDEARNTLKQALVELVGLGLPWYQEQVMRTFHDLTQIMPNSPDCGCGVKGIDRQMSAFGESIISHDLPRKNYPAGRDFTADHLWSTSEPVGLVDRCCALGPSPRADQRHPLTSPHSQQVALSGLSSSSLQPGGHTGCHLDMPALLPSPTCVKQTDQIHGSKRYGEDNDGGDGSEDVKRAWCNYQETTASSESLQDRIMRHQHRMKETLLGRRAAGLELLADLQEKLMHQQNNMPAYPNAHTLQPGWLAGVDVPTQLPEVPYHNLVQAEVVRNARGEGDFLDSHLKIDNNVYELKIVSSYAQFNPHRPNEA